MEEILASIRRIIADDEASPSAHVRREQAERPAAQIAYASPALEKRETFVEPQAPSADIRPLRAPPRETEAAPVYETYQYEETMETSAGPVEEELSDDMQFASPQAEPATPLMSPDAASSIAAHFETLAATMLINDSGVLREYAQEMMRPMLKQWLDDNLPVIVERLVRAEIERVARGGRR